MVMFCEWHRAAVDQTSSGGLPMTGEDTGLGALASPLVGYLGKVQERAASLEQCPWCTSKGLTYSLRSYRINLQESITLCTNPQCLFPLVSRPLEDVLSHLVAVEPTAGKKRKNPHPEEAEESIKCSPKRLRLSEDGSQSVDTVISQTDQSAGSIISNSQREDVNDVNGYDGDFDRPAAETTATGWESPQHEEDVEDAAGHKQDSSERLTADADEAAFPPRCGESDVVRQVKNHPELLNKHHSLSFNERSFTNKDIDNDETVRTEQKPPTADVKSKTEDCSSSSLTESQQLVSVPDQLFWNNSDNLCWLDSLLSALVKCKSLRKSRPEDEPQQSSVWKLIGGYEDVCASIRVHQQTDRDGVVKVPTHVLQKANADLQSLRMSAFKLLQPKLHCELGQRETPVFAMPLLLTTDSWVEPLFHTTFHWEFKCSGCKVATKERLVKTLPTFTKVAPDWHPLRAVHKSPCNVCNRKNQRRTMTLESLSPVFVLHFVEGLPNNDVDVFTFNFQGKRYSITTVVQYKQQLKHFVTWVCDSDGTWLEYDDLKHPQCQIHQKLPVPAQEMHLVFWEVEDDNEARVCSPSSTFTDSVSSKTETRDAEAAVEPTVCSPDQSLLASHNDIICALSAADDNKNDTSIGSTTLLDAFEGLSHNDIVTLTLVELNTESETGKINDKEQTQDLTPDSSSAVTGGETTSLGPDVELLDDAGSSEPESGNSSSSDPTFEPVSRRGRGRGRGAGRGKAVGRQRGKKAAASSEVIKPVCAAAAAQENTQQTPRPAEKTEKTPMMPQTLNQSAHWSFLLSRHPVHRQPAKPAPTSFTPVKPPPPVHSTPNPVKRQHLPPPPLLRPQLRTETEGFPPKAAEMYGGFSAKTTTTPPPTLPSSNKSIINTTEVVGLKVKQHSSKLPPGLSDTDVLRYKLMKKLKAKKKKLAKLNEMLERRPDSTDLLLSSSSPNTVTSSTCDDFLSDLLSPATTASNLSPDSTGLLELLDRTSPVGVGAAAPPLQTTVTNTDAGENFLDEFLSQAVAQRPTEMESEALSALELFM